ncbi:UNVERIFIED_CONTAM: hypothetical protein GTU68_013461 [Idotea baltica]|nr:hypothetical protein [Idotea baltica]
MSSGADTASARSKQTLASPRTCYRTGSRAWSSTAYSSVCHTKNGPFGTTTGSPQKVPIFPPRSSPSCAGVTGGMRQTGRQQF